MFAISLLLSSPSPHSYESAGISKTACFLYLETIRKYAHTRLYKTNGWILLKIYWWICQGFHSSFYEDIFANCVLLTFFGDTGQPFSLYDCCCVQGKIPYNYEFHKFDLEETMGPELRPIEKLLEEREPVGPLVGSSSVTIDVTNVFFWMTGHVHFPSHIPNSCKIPTKMTRSLLEETNIFSFI